jgi:hypothetical protein
VTPLIAPVLGCVLQIAVSEVERRDGLWHESVRLEIGADPGCAWVDIPLHPDSAVVGRGGTIRLGDGGRTRLADARFQALPRSLNGDGLLRVHLVDLRGGDRAIVEIDREWRTDTPFRWQPGTARWAELRATDLSWETAGGVPEPQRGRAWVADPGPDAHVLLTAEGASAAPNPDDTPRLEPPSVRPHWARHLTLVVPKRDPQRALYPGGGSTVRVEERLSFQPEDRDRAWHLEAPGARGIDVRVTPSAEAATVTQRGDDLLIRVAASEGPADVLVAYTLDDAPTYGERRDQQELEVRAPGGRIAWEGDRFWSLADIHQRPILPAREALVTALDRRFRSRSIPEPGLPNSLRGLGPSWDLAERLVPALQARARPAQLALDPALPRPLNRARRSGVLTEVEAGLITWLYARQARLEAHWVLVRPADRGPGGRLSLSGYDSMLVRIGDGDSARWLDPGCTLCAPWEVRPELEGGSIIALPGVTGPAPSPGQWTVVLQPHRVAWQLSGPAALELRRWHAQLAPAEREAALAALVGGVGATLEASRGIDEPGADISLLASRGQGALALPVDLPPVRSIDGTTWLAWSGTRVLRVEDGSALPDPYSGDQLDLTIDGQVVTLDVRERSIGARDAEAMAYAARQLRTATVPQ